MSGVGFGYLESYLIVHGQGNTLSSNIFEDIFHLLFAHFGPQHWWPAQSPFEMMVGAVLTQNTSWRNVAKSIANLKAEGLLSHGALLRARVEEIALHIRSSGYYNIKARRLKHLLQMIDDHYGGELANLLCEDTATARERLLAVKGIGPETADSILLYGGNHPVFVVDTYTHRVFSRHNLVADECGYDELQEEFTCRLPRDWQLYNEYHALIVMVGKKFCRKKNPLCEQCPLRGVNL